MNLIPIRDNIIFKFKDKVFNGFFVDKHSSGIILDMGRNGETSGKYCRVGEVFSVGQDVTPDIKTGDNIVIDHLMWTESFKYNNETYWMTQPKCVLGKLSS